MYLLHRTEIIFEDSRRWPNFPKKFGIYKYFDRKFSFSHPPKKHGVLRWLKNQFSIIRIICKCILLSSNAFFNIWNPRRKGSIHMYRGKKQFHFCLDNTLLRVIYILSQLTWLNQFPMYAHGQKTVELCNYFT